jgi:hypothetical protein
MVDRVEELDEISGEIKILLWVGMVHHLGRMTVHVLGWLGF